MSALLPCELTLTKLFYFLKTCATKYIQLIQDTQKEAQLMPLKDKERPKSSLAMKPNKKNKNQKPKLNITLHDDAKQKLAALARLEKRSVSNLIEVMTDERWEKLAEREGIDYAKTVAEIAGLKGLNADKKADRKVFRREILERVLKLKKR
jgi:hypothetical protein